MNKFKEVKYFNHENYETPMKEIEQDAHTHKMEEHPMLRNWKNLYH